MKVTLLGRQGLEAAVELVRGTSLKNQAGVSQQKKGPAKTVPQTVLDGRYREWSGEDVKLHATRTEGTAPLCRFTLPPLKNIYQ